MLAAIRRANDDGEFALAARMWDADVVFAGGADTVRMTVRGGRIEEAGEVPRKTSGAIRISGPEEGWLAMLQPMPRPFYHDLYGAIAHHGFWMEGRIEDVGPYYAALRRLIELARTEGTA